MTRLLPPLVVALLVFASCRQQPPAIPFEELSESDKHLPQYALAGLEVAEGLEVALFAHEPMLINPTNMHVDERGRVWVCEALNYRNTHNPENPYRQEGDRILILEDTNHDGKADKRTVFYQDTSINAALGIWAAANRAIVSCSPNVFILTDTDGDDKADVVDTLFTGLGGYQTDHAVHAFVMGPDGRLYFNFGNTGAQIRDKAGNLLFDPTLSKPIENTGPFRQGMIFRCRPDGTGLEVIAHNFRNNYEVAVDSYGSLWQSDNDDDGNKGVRINFVMEYGNYGYTDEMTGAGWGEYRLNLEPEIPLQHWHLNDPGVVPNLLQTGSGSPCGMVVYEGDLLPAIFQNQMLHAEAGHNVVRAYPVQPDGAGYKATIVNLLKSKDQWFRPSDVCIAPDGSVFIADWYDPAVGGHKFGDPERGRIYRVAPKVKRYKVPHHRYDDVKNALAALSSPNLSVQALAAEALRKGGPAAYAALEKVFKNGENPRIRARALWLMGSFEGKTEQSIEAGLKDANADIRITALRLARQLQPERLEHWIAMVVKDSSPQVRREAAIALRFRTAVEADTLWAELAKQYDGKDRWYLEALGIGADLHAESRFAAWKTAVGDAWNNEAGKEIVWRSKANRALPLLKELAANAPADELQRYLRAFDFHRDPAKNALLASLLEVERPGWDTLKKYVLYQVDAGYAQADAAVRKQVSALLPRLYGTSDYLDLVAKLQMKDQNPKLLQMVLKSEKEGLSRRAAELFTDAGGFPLLLRSFKGADEATALRLLSAVAPVYNRDLMLLYLQYVNDKARSIAVRRAAISGFNSSWDGQIFLMNAVKDGHIPEEYKSQALVALSNAWNTDIRQQSRAMLARRQEQQGSQLPPVAILENRSGNIASGKQVFSQFCAVCHQINGEGTNFGPALSEIGSKLDKGALLQAILYPSSGINYGYEGHNLLLKDGATAQGIIESRTADKITLRIMGGTSRTIPTADIAKMEEMPQSLMTEGLYRSFSEQQLVDLVEYLSSLRSPDTASND